MPDERKPKVADVPEERKQRIVDIPSARRPMDVQTGRGRPMRAGGEDDEGTGIWWKLLLGAAVVLALIFLVIVPGYEGYKVYRAMQDSGVPEQYLSDMQGLSDAKAAAESHAQALEGDANASMQRAQEADAAKAACEQSLAACQRDASASQAQCGSSVDSLTQARDDALSQVEKDKATIDDAARRICCVRKVENPLVTGYEVLDGAISCVESGGQPISC